MPEPSAPKNPFFESKLMLTISSLFVLAFIVSMFSSGMSGNSSTAESSDKVSDRCETAQNYAKSKYMEGGVDDSNIGDIRSIVKDACEE